MAGTYTFSNNISGDAGFIKNGTGTLKFTGNLTYTGNTTINDGNLVIKGVTYNSSSTRIVKGNLVQLQMLIFKMMYKMKAETLKWKEAT